MLNNRINTPDELKNDARYEYHHTASCRGYESRRGEGHIEPYSGRFGKGYVWYIPRRDTAQYRYVAYYIERG